MNDYNFSEVMAGMAVMYLVYYAFLVLVVAVLFGTDRKIGVFGSIIVSILFTPFVGVLVCCLYKRNEDHKREVEMLDTMKKILEAV